MGCYHSSTVKTKVLLYEADEQPVKSIWRALNIRCTRQLGLMCFDNNSTGKERQK